VSDVARFLPPGEASYTAEDVVGRLVPNG